MAESRGDSESLQPPSAGGRKALVWVVVAVAVVATIAGAAVLLLGAPPSGPATRFEITASTPTPILGDAVTLTVRALRADGIVAAGYRGTVNFTADVSSRVVLPADATFGAADAGVRTASGLRFLAHGTAVITAWDAAASIQGTVSLRGRATPQADFRVERTEPAGPDFRFHLDAAASSDADGSVSVYNWTWGDSTSSQASAPQTNHVYPRSRENETLTIVLRVTDDEGLSGSVSKGVRITLQPLPPNAAFTATAPDALTWYVDVDASGSSDPNADLLYYNWTWGDGKRTDGTSPTARHRFSAVGTYTVNLTVEDSTGLRDWTERTVTVNARPYSIDYEFYDFFAVPYEEFWDKRASLYWELPVNAECFTQAAIDVGNCTPTEPGVPDVLAYPYMHYYSPGTPGPGSTLVPSIWAPYRMRVTGVNVPGYTLAEPVILPVFNASQSAGFRLDFDWYMQYLDSPRGYQIEGICGTNFVFGNDGYILESQVVVTMDLQESRRIFDVRATDAASARAWWGANTNPSCLFKNATETKLNDWFRSQGGTQLLMGKYDIANGYEWYYDSFGINVSATVDDDGTTRVRIDHYAWGTEALMSRWLYWGATNYYNLGPDGIQGTADDVNNSVDSTKAAGWWRMENGWFEDFRYVGVLGPTNVDFTLNSVVQYHLQELCTPGPNSVYDRVDDAPFWQWGPFLLDYVNDFFPRHPASELDRMPGASFPHCVAGAPPNAYGQDLEYDYTPIAWNLKAGDTWHFTFPSGDIIVHDPNLTPPGADPRLGQFVEVSGPMELWNTKPAGYGEWDPTGLTWDVIGPSTTGGPAGSPGPDGVVGTADDDYALEPWPQFNFLVQGAAPSGVSPSVGTSAPSASATTAPTGREDLTLRLAVGPAGYAAASAGAAVRRHRSPEVAVVRSEVV